jgi:hypothetical protein
MQIKVPVIVQYNSVIVVVFYCGVGSFAVKISSFVVKSLLCSIVSACCIYCCHK